MKKPFLLLLFNLFSFASSAQLRLPRLVRDSMVMQRDKEVNIWGWAARGEKVTVHFLGKQLHTVANSDGKWAVVLPPQKAGGPYTMELAASNKITIKEILFGDVWLCAGQSNMVHQMELHKETYGADIASAHYPQIRHFGVPVKASLQHPEEDLQTGFWKWANPENVRQFSAVAFFFA
jgi:sialate O-acetylesterase